MNDGKKSPRVNLSTRPTQVLKPSERRRYGETMERFAWLWFNQTHPGERRLLAQNQAWRGGELDLVFEEKSKKGVLLVFCEVRCRNHARITAVETLTHGKRKRLRNSAARFLARYTGPARGVRFDLLGWNSNEGWKWWPSVLEERD